MAPDQDPARSSGAGRPPSGWPAIIASLLQERPPDRRSALLETAVSTARKVTRADGVMLVEWTQEHGRVVQSSGQVPEALCRRPPEGAGALHGRPLIAASLDPYWDLIALRSDESDAFTAREALALEAVIALLRRADMWHPREAAGTLYRLATEILETLDLDRVLLSVTNAGSNLLSADIAGVFFVEDGELQMRHVIGHRSVGTARLRMKAGEGVAGKVWDTGHPLRVDDYASSELISKEFLPVAMEEGTQSALCVPMFDRGQEIIGVLGAWRRRRSVFTDDDEQLLVGLAGLASIAVTNARLFDSQQRLTGQLQNTQSELEQRCRVAEETVEVHERLLMIAAEGPDLRALTRAVHDLVHGPVMLVAPDGTLLAAHPHVQTDPLPEVLDRSKQESAEKRHRSSVYEFDHYFWLVCSIQAASVRYGRLYARLNAPPSAEQAMAAEQAALVCALLLAHGEAVGSTTRRLQSDFIWDLLDGRIGDEEEAESRAMHLGYRFDAPSRLFLFRTQGFKELSSAEGWTPEELERARNWLAQRVTRLLEQETSKPIMSAYRGDEFVAMVPQVCSPAAARQLGVASVKESPFPSVELTAGIGPLAFTITELQRSLHRARVALSATGTGEQAVVFEDLGILQFILAPGTGEDLSRFTRSVLGPLFDYDQRTGSELLRTLDVFLDSGCAQAKTAGRLYLHPKSVRYRLRRIGEITGLDLQSREDRLKAELALQFLTSVHSPLAPAPAPVPAPGALDPKPLAP